MWTTSEIIPKKINQNGLLALFIQSKIEMKPLSLGSDNT